MTERPLTRRRYLSFTEPNVSDEGRVRLGEVGEDPLVVELRDGLSGRC